MGLRGRARKFRLEVRLEVARSYVFGPDDHRTIPYLEESIERYPESPELRMMMAIACETNRPEQVGPEARRAAELAPTNVAMQLRAGHSCAESGEVAAARDCIARVREQIDEGFEQMVELVRLEGTVASREQKLAEAEERFRTALAADPGDAGSAWALARFLWARGHGDEALTVLDEAMWEGGGPKQSLLDLRAHIAGDTATDA
jgi:Flp pilus assembly protein TadD